MNDRVLRGELAGMLRGDQAHVALPEAVDGLAPALRCRRPSASLRSVFEELEHLRLTQQDLLRYMLDSTWQSPQWPAGYWPPPNQQVSPAQWQATLDACNTDLQALLDLVADSTLDLTAAIPHAPQHTYLRELLLAADHNSYQIGQIVRVRRELGAWPDA